MTAILFGSISTLADTSELQRRAFNEAFAAHGLDWNWEQEDYAARLEKSGGADRVSEYAEERGEEVDAAAVHATKSEVFQRLLGEADLTPREGVVETVREGKARGAKLALVTTTSTENVTALLGALQHAVREDDFDLVVDSSAVEQPKPDAAVYQFALAQLGEAPEACVAIEDNAGGVEAAVAADVPVIAFPNTNTRGHSFPGARATVTQLDPADLLPAA